MQIRRVVAGRDSEGKAVVLSDEAAPCTKNFASLPGFSSTLLWATPAVPKLRTGHASDPTTEATSVVPEGGETRILMVTFPPDTEMARAEFDPIAFAAEFQAASPGLAEKFEPEHPGMHTTDSIDYDVVLEGEVTLELDDGVEVLLKRHDVSVQHGNRHAWRNKTDRPATMLFVLIGAAR